MLIIFTSDALVDIIWEFLFQNLWNDSARRVQFNVSFSPSKNNSSFVSSKSVAMRCGGYLSRVIVIAYRIDYLKADYLSDLLTPKVICF